MKLRVATRGSRLSLIQVEIAMEYARKAIPNLEYETVIVKTRGDVVRDRPLYAIGGKGLFEKEVDRAVLEGRADVAVHSLKDMPSDIHPDLEIVLVPPRGPVNDVLVFRDGARVAGPEALPEGFRVGTSSLRRRAMLLYANPGLRVEPIRGNVDTRLRKLMEGGYDAIVLAEAGIERIGASVSYYRLPIPPFVPAPGQGVIAVTAIRDSKAARMLRGLSDKWTLAMVEAEREFLRHAGAGCHSAVGGVALRRGNGLEFVAAVYSLDGSQAHFIRVKGWPEEARKLGRLAGEFVHEHLDKISEGQR